jgi:RNA polymerase sigma factor (sigma-70 family)
MKSAALRHPARLAGASLLRLQSDARLTELAAAGHEAAFDAIVDRYRTPLMRYCAGIVGPSRAEDAVQQALINAHEAMTRTDEVRHLKSWLYRIAHNAALNVLRAVKDDVPLDEATLGARAGAPGDRGPAESYERSEQFRATLAAVQALPERQRAALVLRELEGRSHEEIAAALGVTTGSARQHLMRGRAAVRSAVTAITPYPLVARLAETLSGGGAGASAGWADAAAGAGASATLMKLGAGVAATGALVGGAVGTQHVVRGGPAETATSRAAERTAQKPATTVAKTAPAALRETAARAPVKRASLTPAPASKRSAPRKPPKRAPSPRPARVAPPAASVPAAQPETTSHSRGQAGADHGHKGRGEQHHDRGHGSDQQTNRSSGHGQSEGKGQDGAKKPKSTKGGKKAKGDKAKPGSSSPAEDSGQGKSKGQEKSKGQGKDKEKASSPAADQESASGPGSSKALKAPKAPKAVSPSGPVMAPATTTSTPPPATPSGEDE